MLRELKALPDTQDTIFVALSGTGEYENEQSGSDGGFDHHVIKPTSHNDLLDDLLALIQSHQA